MNSDRFLQIVSILLFLSILAFVILGSFSPNQMSPYEQLQLNVQDTEYKYPLVRATLSGLGDDKKVSLSSVPNNDKKCVDFDGKCLNADSCSGPECWNLLDTFCDLKGNGKAVEFSKDKVKESKDFLTGNVIMGESTAFTNVKCAKK